VNDRSAMSELAPPNSSPQRSSRTLDADCLRQLSQPGAYPHSTGAIELRETHISWILLTGKIAYKLKKPVNLGFLDFSSLGKRRHYCLEELRLNRRFAPELYLDVVAVTDHNGRVKIGGTGSVIDYAVKMRQFADDELLGAIASEGRLDDSLAILVGARVAGMHQQLPEHAIESQSQNAGPGTPASILSAIRQNFNQIWPYLDTDECRVQLSQLESWSYDRYEALEPVLKRRLGEGFVRECHGDLHLDNLALIEGRVTPFDCIEFNRAFRLIDVQCELAMLLMDLDSRGLAGRSNQVLNSYLEVSGDYGGLEVLYFYQVYTALVRAKVALLKGAPAKGRSDRLPEQYHHYVNCAEINTNQRKQRPRLVLMCGVSGSGKSVVAEYLANTTDAIRIRSDVERKRLLGMAPNPSRHEVLAVGEIYSADVTKRTFQRLKQLAEIITGAAFTCIVDATFISAELRAQFVLLASQLGVEPVVIYCDASVPELERRIRARQELGEDPSDATVDVMRRQLLDIEPPDCAELCPCLLVDTEDPDWREHLGADYEKYAVLTY
jgi:aminoglycoside phosphotransferase family enzyme/predicted kinase